MGIFDLFKNLSSTQSRGVVSLDTARRIKNDWENVAQLIKVGGPSQLRQALITADKLVDNALKEIVSGETMSERLKNAKDVFDRSVYQKIWDAHRLRNNLVHEIGFEPPHFVVKESIENLRYALSKIGINI